MKTRNDIQQEVTLIASNLEDIIPIRYQEANRTKSFNINGGTPAAILYLSVLDALFPDAGYDVQAHNYATSMILEYKHTPNIGIGLFGGGPHYWLGVCSRFPVEEADIKARLENLNRGSSFRQDNN